MLNANAGAGGTDLAGWTLELGVGTLAASTFTCAAAVAYLPVLGQTGGSVQGAVAGAAGVVGITDALPAFAASMSW